MLKRTRTPFGPIFSATRARREASSAGNSTDASKYRSLIAFLDAQTLETKFQVSFVGNADIASSGKDGRFVFVTMYNTENAVSSEGMIERDRDAVDRLHTSLLSDPAWRQKATSGDPEARQQILLMSIVRSAPIKEG